MHVGYDVLRDTALATQLPTEWMKRASEVKREHVDYLSIFGGKEDCFGRFSSRFNLVGLPPIDAANTTAPCNL